MLEGFMVQGKLDDLVLLSVGMVEAERLILAISWLNSYDL